MCVFLSYCTHTSLRGCQQFQFKKFNCIALERHNSIYSCAVINSLLAEIHNTLLISGPSHLRQHRDLSWIVPLTQRSATEAAFSVQGPALWNKLPHDIKAAKKKLNTHF